MTTETLEILNPRDYWPNEAHDFTPWLAERLDWLSEDIGIDPPLKAIEREASVGRFSADIHAINPSDNGRVVIENQLDRSDHVHLGQILLYLAGLEAETLIWIAPSFSDEHLNVIQWLNENTGPQFNFLAVELLLYSFGDSEPIPRFDVLKSPSSWWNARRIAIAQEHRAEIRDVRAMIQEKANQQSFQAAKRTRTPKSAVGQFRREFWGYYSERYPLDGVARGFAGINPDYRVEDTGLKIRRFVARWGVGLWIETTSSDKDPHTLLEFLEPHMPNLSASLDSEYGAGINFITGLRNPVGCFDQLHIDTHDRQTWPQAADWLHNQLKTYRQALGD